MIKIGILYTGEISNICSLKNAIQYLGFESFIIKQPNQIYDMSKIIIPGVGSFPVGVKNLKKYRIFKEIRKLKKTKVLGICLGMQILCEQGFEFKRTNGLKLINGQIKKIDNLSELPHVGFKKVSFLKKDKLFSGIKQKTEFYFTHSYELKNYSLRDIIANVKYSNKSIVAAIKNKNFYGVQFHPEKSGEIGLRLLNNFIKLK
jgi:glutamine amidotransferase